MGGKRSVFAIAICLILAMGCATTKDGGTGKGRVVKTEARGSSSGSVRTGVITTTTAEDGTVTETCGTPESPCQESTSVGGEGSEKAWEAVLDTIKTLGIVAGFAFGL